MRSLKRDLIERRLWPLVVVILAAIVAVPFVLHSRRANAAIASPPATKGASHPATAGAHRTHTSTDQRTTPTSRTRDPFEAADVSKPSTKKRARPNTTATTGSTSTTTTAASDGSSAPTDTAGSSSAGDSSSTDAASQTTPTTTPVVTTPVSTSPGTSTGASTTTTTTWDVYSVDLRVEADGRSVAHRDVARLSPLPTERAPQLMYMGVADHGRRAVFALGAGVEVRADGRTGSAGAFCDPTREDCALVVIPAGKSVVLSYVTATGATRSLVLRLSGIASQVTHSESTVNAVRHHVSAVGLCDLKLGDPIGFFDPADENVRVPSTAVCRKNKLAVPFPGSLGAGSSDRG